MKFLSLPRKCPGTTIKDIFIIFIIKIRGLEKKCAVFRRKLLSHCALIYLGNLGSFFAPCCLPLQLLHTMIRDEMI